MLKVSVYRPMPLPQCRRDPAPKNSPNICVAMVCLITCYCCRHTAALLTVVWPMYRILYNPGTCKQC